jgi:hypothetical protein
MSLDPKVRAWIGSLDNARLMFNPELRMLRDAFFEAERERDAAQTMMVFARDRWECSLAAHFMVRHEIEMEPAMEKAEKEVAESWDKYRKAAGLED